MDNSFVILPNTQKAPTKIVHNGFSVGLRRKELIDAVCDDTERRHYTQYPNVIKLCRVCMKDVCKELTERMNWETTLYNRYNDKLQAADCEPAFKPDLTSKIEQCKCRYADCNTLLSKFQKVKLCTDACIICAELK